MEKLEKLKRAIAERLKLARELSGLSQSQAAKLLDLSRPTISEIEAGRRNVTSHELSILSEIYDVDVEWVLDKDIDDRDNSRNKVKLAARELSKMSENDVDKLLKLLSSMKKSR